MSWSNCQRCLSSIPGQELQLFPPIETNTCPSPSFSWIEIRDELWVLSLQLLLPTLTNLFLTWKQTTASAWEKKRSFTKLHQEGWMSSLGVGQRKESLSGGSSFRENHPKMSHLLYTLLCPCRRSSLKRFFLGKIPEKSLNWGCSFLDARWSSAPGLQWASRAASLWASLLISSS